MTLCATCAPRGRCDNPQMCMAPKRDLAAEVLALRAEVERLRGEIKDVRRFADEWAISRAVGDLSLEGAKADQLWNRIRGASARTAPIEGSAALGEAP